MKFEILKNYNSYYQPYYWRIKSANGEILAHSEMYSSKESCKKAISTIKTNAATSEVVDLAI